MNRYWMEDSYGKYGVDLEGYGPYLLPGTQDEYFITDFANTSFCNTQTRTWAAQANVTDVQVVSIGQLQRRQDRDRHRRGNLSRVVTAIPDATHLTTGRATVFSAASLAGATNIKVTSVAGTRRRPRPRTSASTIGSRRGRSCPSARQVPGARASTLTPALTFAHATNTIVRDMIATPIHGDRQRRSSIRAAAATATRPSSHGPITSRRPSAQLRQHLLRLRRPGRERHVAGIRRDAVHASTTVPDAWGPPNPEIPQNWAGTRYIPWTSWRIRGDDLAERIGHQLHRGRGLGHGRLRPRADPQPGHRRQLQQPVRRPVPAAGHRLLEHDEPRLVRRTGRHPQPLAHPLHEGHGARFAARHARQDRARLRHGRRTSSTSTATAWPRSGLVVVESRPARSTPARPARPASASTSTARAGRQEHPVHACSPTQPRGCRPRPATRTSRSTASPASSSAATSRRRRAPTASVGASRRSARPAPAARA